MKPFTLALAPAAFIALAVPAAAQDRDRHFNGLYVSGFGGLAAQPSDPDDAVIFDRNGDDEFADTVVTSGGANAFSPGFCNGRATSTGPATGCSNDKDRVEYGARVGFDSRMGGNFVVGALVEVAKNDSVDGVTAFSTTPAFYEFTRGMDFAVSARARAGFTPGGGALFYVTGGGSYARLDHGFRTSNAANTFTLVDSDEMVWGYQGGGGAEVMLTDNVSLGIEYLFNRYKDDKFYVEVGQGTAPATNPFVLNGGTTAMRPSVENFTYHSLRGALSFRF